MAKQKPLSKREKARIAKMRREPGGRLSLEVARYLKTVGWNVLITSGAQVRGFNKDGGLGSYEFVVPFTGSRIKAVVKSGKVPPPPVSVP